MIDWLIREAIFTAWIAGIVGSWRVLRWDVLPVALDRCPWMDGVEGPDDRRGTL